MRLNVKLGLRDASEDPFMGIGLVRLLRGVERTGSLNRAAGEMDMSYSKAHKLVKRLEDALGYPALDAAAGGSRGGGSSLTPRGRRFLERYEALDAAVRKEADRLFRRSFPGGRL